MPVKKPLKKVVAHPVGDWAGNVAQSVPDKAVGVALATVPEKKYFTSYISRKVGTYNDLDLLDYAYMKGQNVLIYGPTGPGKTSFTMAWAASRRKKFYSVASNIAIDPSQMFGKMSVKEDGTFGWFDGGLTDIVRHGGVILINEVNFMPDRIATVLFELLDKRREITLLDHKGEKIRAHRPDCWCDLDSEACKSRWILVVADMNPDYSGTRPLNAAFRNRFPIQIEWDYDPAIEDQLVASPTILKIARNIRKQIGTRIDTPVATNMLMEFVAIANDLGVPFAVSNFCNHFTTEERPAVQGVFEQLKNDLNEDFTPDEAPDWDQYAEDRDEWMYEADADEDADVPGDEDWIEED